MSLSGRVTDAKSGINNISAKSDQYSDVSFSVSLSGDVWLAGIPLELGSNLITLEARDKKGNQSSLQVTVDRQQANVVIDLLIDSPSANSVQDSDNLVVQGRLISEARVLSPQVFVNDVAAQVAQTNDPTQFSFVSNTLTLVEGTNVIRITTTVNEQRLQRLLPVIYQPEKGALPPPSISISSPVPGRYLLDQSFSLRGEVVSFAGNVSFTINGQPVSLQAGDSTQGSFSELFSFAETDSELSLQLELFAKHEEGDARLSDSRNKMIDSLLSKSCKWIASRFGWKQNLEGISHEFQAK